MAQSNGPPSSQTMAPPRTAHWMGIPWYAALLATPLLIIALGCGMVRASIRLPTALSALGSAPGPVYTVSVLQQRLTQHPGDWLGRTVLVTGQMTTYDTWIAPSSLVMRLALFDPDAPGVAPPLDCKQVTCLPATELTLRWGGVDPLLGFLRHLPLIGRLAPQPQTLRWDRTATYRARLQAVPDSSCGVPNCYEAVLLDATPDSQ